MVQLEEVAQCDYVIPSVPLEAYPELLTALQPHLRPDSVIVDVCSVKVKPLTIVKDIMPSQPVVATHPMFGPESASISFAGHTFVMCPEVSDPNAYQTVKHLANSLGLGVVEMSADEHDQEIAVVQGLTFFIARALSDMHVHDQKLFTPSFERLLKLAELEQHHSLELFKTIQQGNPHTQAVRDNFIRVITDINRDLTEPR